MVESIEGPIEAGSAGRRSSPLVSNVLTIEALINVENQQGDRSVWCPNSCTQPSRSCRGGVQSLCPAVFLTEAFSTEAAPFSLPKPKPHNSSCQPPLNLITDTMSTLVFLTGASKGFGRALALEVAKAVPSHLALVRNLPPSCFFTARSS